jgi:hypothetical protein
VADAIDGVIEGAVDLDPPSPELPPDSDASTTDA